VNRSSVANSLPSLDFVVESLNGTDSDDSEELASVALPETVVIFTISLRYDIQKARASSERNISKFEEKKIKITLYVVQPKRRVCSIPTREIP
jgi:hypothetical protein